MSADQGQGVGLAALGGAAVRIGAMTGGLWLLLVAALQVIPAGAYSYQTGTWLGLAALLPVILASMAAKSFYIVHGKTVSMGESAVLFAMLVGPMAVMAGLVEAQIYHDMLGPAPTLGFAEVLGQPLATRYSVTVLFGVSFLTCALGATLFGCMFQFPTKLRELDALVRGTS